MWRLRHPQFRSQNHSHIGLNAPKIPILIEVLLFQGYLTSLLLGIGYWYWVKGIVIGIGIDFSLTSLLSNLPLDKGYLFSRSLLFFKTSHWPLCNILTSLLASLLLDWLLGVDPTAHRLLIRVLQQQIYCQQMKQIYCQIVIGWKIPGDQSSRSLLCQGGRRLAPEAHSQAQLPAQDQSIVNVHKQIYINIH